MSNEIFERRKQLQGIVLSNKMQKTVVVRISVRMRHPKLQKVLVRHKKVYAHSERVLPVGTEVCLVETRPLSKLKRWRVVSKFRKSQDKVDG